jgi:hypothetical protein
MIGGGETTGQSWPRLRTGLLASTAFAGVLLASEAARAACTPAAANNVTATCTGTTTNQGTGAPGTSAGVDGYGTFGLTNLNVTVAPGASVIQTNLGAAATAGITGQTLTVTNSGTVTGRNGLSDGAGLGSSTTLTNFGTITGVVANGVNGNTVTVTNSGTITGANNGIGVLTATVTNSGTITGTGIAGINIAVAVTNSGTITGALVGLQGGSGTPLIVTNSGAISGTGTTGVNADGATVTNSGTISGGSFGISTTAPSSVTNSGTIIGPSAAIRFNDDGVARPDTLTVLPGARFGGLVDFGGGADTVNFAPGSWVLNTANFNAGLSTINTGGNAFLVTPNQIVVADLSGFGAMNRAVMDITGWISSVLPDSPVFAPAPGGGSSAFAAIDRTASPIDDAFASFPADAMGYLPKKAPKAPIFKAGTVAYSDGSSVWAKAFGGRREQDTKGAFFGSVTTGYGGALGYERRITPDLSLGGFVGASANKTDLKLNAGGSDTNAAFAGLYGRRTFGASFLDLSLIGGRLDNISTRNINGGLAMEAAHASYGGWFINPALMLGHRFALAGDLTLTPAFKARYVAVQFDGYTENGSTANLTVGSRNLRALEERGELTLAGTRYLSNSNRITWRATAGVLGQQRSGDATVAIAFLGQNVVAATPDRANVTGVFGGAGLDWQFGQTVLFAAAELTSTNDSTKTFSAKGGGRVTW